MQTPEVPLLPQCLFCAKTQEESELIEMSTNSIFIDEEVFEFEELLRDLFDSKLQQEQDELICEDCKNLLIHFHIFKKNVRKKSIALENENIDKVRIFLEENEEEKVFCLRYNKCLALVPESKKSFMETFQYWQPQVIIERLQDLPPRSKIMKLDEKVLKAERKTELVHLEVVEDTKDIQDQLQYEEDMQSSQMTEEEWLQAQIGTSEYVETETGEEIESWPCVNCGERFLDMEDLKSHLLANHLGYERAGTEKPNESFEMIECDESSYYQDQEDSINSIEDISMKQEIVVQDFYQCSNCDFTTTGRIEFRIHQKTHFDEKSFKSTRFERLFCSDCCYQFTTQGHYQAHLNGHQLYEIVARHARYPVCDVCNVMFCDNASICFHQEKHEIGAPLDEAMPAEGGFLKLGHHRADLEPNDPETIVDGSIRCGHCLKTFPSEENCRLHQLIFHISKLECPIENRIFNGNQAFSIHLRNNHPEIFGEDGKFLCSVCKAEFETIYEKLKHMKNCDKKKFQCTHCDKKFSQKCYLMTHLKMVSGQINVTCDICQKVCRDKGDFQIHYRSHSNIKPFQCSLCDKAYKTSSARASHLDTHMEKGFECEYCVTKFKSRRTLQKHKKMKHPYEKD